MPTKLNKKSLIKKTSEVLTVIDSPPRFIQGNESKSRFFNKNGYSIGFAGNAVDMFEEAIKIISNSPNYIDISKKKIEDEYVQSLINILLLCPTYSEETIKLEIDCYLERIEESIEERRVLIPIESLKLVGIPELQIGNVQFREFDSIRELEISKLYNIIDNNPFIPVEQKKFERKYLEEIITESYANRVCAEIVVRSEVNQSYFKALYEVGNAMNLLKCYIPLLFSRSTKVQIGIYGDHNNLSAGLRSFFSISNQDGGFHCSSERFGPLEPYIISPDKLKHLEENCYLGLLSGILTKDVDSRKDLEKRLLNAIRWIGAGIQSGNDCDKLLMFIISIECLLMNRDEEGKASPIAERCAFLLSDLPERRIKTDKKLKELYNKRSEIVHEGLTEITAEEVGSAQWLAISCLFAVCKRLNNWESLDQLIRWVKEQRYGINHKTAIDVSSTC